MNDGVKTDKLDELNEIFEYLKLFQERAWDGLIYHKIQINKLVYWSASAMVTLLVATRFLGVENTESILAIPKVLESPVTIAILFLIFLAQFSFVLHHHLLVKFYSTILKRVNDLLFDNGGKHFVFARCRSPYYLYRTVFLHKKHTWPHGKDRLSLFGAIGGYIYVFLVVLFLLPYLIFNSAVAAFDPFEHGVEEVKQLRFYFTLFISYFGALILIILPLVIHDDLRKKYNSTIDERFDDLSVEIEDLKKAGS